MGKLGDLLKEARNLKGLKQPDVARHLRLKRPISISKWETGQAPIPWHHFRPLMDLLDIPDERFINLARREIPSAVELYERALSTRHYMSEPKRSYVLSPKLDQLARHLDREQLSILERCAEVLTEDEKGKNFLAGQLDLFNDMVKGQSKPSTRSGTPQKAGGGRSA